MLNELWLSDSEAVELGLADEVEGADAEDVVEDVLATIKAEIVDVEPEPAPAPAPVMDFGKLFDDITQSNEEKFYAGVA